MAEDNIRQLINRFTELSSRAYDHNIFTHTEFLSMAEQDILLSLRLPAAPEFIGGYDGAERRIAVFGKEEDIGYAFSPPVSCIKIQPLSQKFAQDFVHRDILGSVMSLGIERKVTGDIIISEKSAYIFCLENISEYIIENLNSVRNTSVKCSCGSVPQSILNNKKEKTVFVASLRVDAMISAAYNLGRSAAKELVENEKVFINARLVKNAGQTACVGDIISVRGYGRFSFDGITKTTKKGNLCAVFSIY